MKMRAKLVENIENINFKRGQDSKEALEIGGIKLEEFHEEIFSLAIKEWAKFKESLIGEKISGYFFPTTPMTLESQKMVIDVIDVMDVLVGKDIPPSIAVKSGITKKWWRINPRENIYFL